MEPNTQYFGNIPLFLQNGIVWNLNNIATIAGILGPTHPTTLMLNLTLQQFWANFANMVNMQNIYAAPPHPENLSVVTPPIRYPEDWTPRCETFRRWEVTYQTRDLFTIDKATYKCKACGLEYEKFSSAKRHFANKHSPPPKKIIKKEVTEHDSNQSTEMFSTGQSNQ